ncbi:hypothetical protein K474DRAFT_1590053 [Panus rudis PR-1116 ss-1]|nr:hypothetical protein K474DRAFT_1590053 [Panus rudis PR-1116 ss-1]
MATRRRVGFSNNSSEASRRQLMQPVPCWEKVWTTPENAPAGTTIKVYRWVKTEKRQQFSDDEGETDQPLAPLPDEPEVVEGDEEMDQDETATSAVPDTTPASRAVSEPAQPKDDSTSKAATPKPHPLSVSFQPPSPPPAPQEEDGLDLALQPAGEAGGSDVVDIGDINAAIGGDMSLDISQLGPDGEPFEGAADISQLQASDALLGGGPLLDQAMDDDPFASHT